MTRLWAPRRPTPRWTTCGSWRWVGTWLHNHRRCHTRSCSGTSGWSNAARWPRRRDWRAPSNWLRTCRCWRRRQSLVLWSEISRQSVIIYSFDCYWLVTVLRARVAQGHSEGWWALSISILHNPWRHVPLFPLRYENVHRVANMVNLKLTSYGI